MKTKVTMIALFLCFLGTTWAQQKFTLRGVVLDSTENSRISYVEIHLDEAKITAETDADGKFEISGLDRGTYVLRVNASGYDPESVSVQVPSQELTIYLNRKTYRLQPILVTAQIAQSRKTPVTFSNLSQKTIHEQYAIQDVPVILSQLPSITEYSENGEGIGYSYITMRGFDQRRISIMVDGIPQNDPEDHNVYWIDMPDLQASTGTIQVQRGAGTEFYGPPAIGGSINIETTNLANQRKLNVTFGAGSTGSPNGIAQRYSTTFSSGLVGGKYSFYAHMAKSLTTGYRQDSWVNLNSYFLSATRYDEKATTEIDIYGGPISDGLSYLGLPKFAALDKNLRTLNWDDWNSDSNMVNYSPHMTRFISSNGLDTVYAVPRRNTEIENFSQPHFSVMNEWEVSPVVTLNNSVFAIYGSGFYNYDGSWADTSYFRITSQYGFNPTQNPSDALIHAYVGLQQYGWLPRVTIRHQNGTLVLGAELDRNYSDHWATIDWANNLPAGVSSDYRYNQWHARTDVATAYGHELYSINPRTTLMLDLEYEFKQYKFYGEKFVGTQFIVPYHFLNPRIGINYNFSHTSNAYLSVSQTSREPQLASIYNADESSGGETPNFALNANGTYNFGEPLIKPETLDDYEFGYHYNNGRLTFGLTAYWMEFYNELVSNGLLDQYGQPITGNAKRTRHVGLELEANAIITNNFALYGNISVSRNKLIEYTSYIDTTGNTIANGISLDGNTLGGFPELLGNIRATYATDNFSAVLLGQYVGSQYTDNFQLASREISPYFIVNGWLSYRIRDFLSLSSVDFKLYVNNLLNRLYIAHGEGIYFYPAATRNFFITCSVDL
ncbi:MAG: TonB-dependent receptor [Bacteroidetes bacterium]|nr:TonB-dependent receptor [Bacteroidota bacterium]